VDTIHAYPLPWGLGLILLVHYIQLNTDMGYLSKDLLFGDFQENSQVPQPMGRPAEKIRWKDHILI
jgi:hypothetical protein